MKIIAFTAFAALLGLSQAQSKGSNLTAAAYTTSNVACTNTTTNCVTGYCCGYFYNILPTQHDVVAAPASNWTNVTSTFSGQCAPAEFNASSWIIGNSNVAFQCLSPWTTIRVLVGDLPAW